MFWDLHLLPYDILVISGASGSGKTTTCHLLEKYFPTRYSHILFDRSRKSRPGEFGSRHVDFQTMYKNYQNGLYTNIASVTHGGIVAIRWEDVKHAFTYGRIAVMEFPLEQISSLNQWFPDANITVIELVAPSEKERLRRLIKDHKYTDERIEGSAYGKGRIDAYKKGKLLTVNNHDLTLITERDNLMNTVLKINQYMIIKSFTMDKLIQLERLGIEYVKAFLMRYRFVGNQYYAFENIDEDFIELFRLQVIK